MAEIDRYMIHSAVLGGLPEFLEGRGVDFPSLAKAAGVSIEDQPQIGQYYHLSQFSKLLQMASMLTEDDTTGLRYGLSLDNRIGGYWYAFMNAPNLRGSLECILRYIRLQVDLSHVSLIVEQDRAEFRWGVSPLLVHTDQFADFSMAQLISRIRLLVGERWRPLRIELARPAPLNASIYRELLCATVKFGCSANAILLDRATLDRPNVNADPNLFDVACELNNRLLLERPTADDIETRIREDVIRALPNELSLADEARCLGISARGLQRRLAESGTTFQDLVDDTRKNLAHRYLSDTQCSMSEIAHELGFSALGNFTRACKRWFDTSPTQYRTQSKLSA